MSKFKTFSRKEFSRLQIFPVDNNIFIWQKRLAVSWLVWITMETVKLLLTAFGHPSKFYLFNDHIHRFKKELSSKTRS
jgi:hypothetical protein